MDPNRAPNRTAEPEAAQTALPAIGDAFNPFKMFVGLFVPEPLVRYRGVHPSGKFVWARLARYSGKDGVCYPAVPTLADEVGLSVRQTQTYLATLEREGFLRRIARQGERGQTSNLYEFLWHPIFDAWANQQMNSTVKQSAPNGVKDTAPGPVNGTAPKESHAQESHPQESQSDSDCAPTNRKKRDSQPRAGVGACRQYPQLREVMARYFMETGQKKLYPRDRLVVDVMDAASGASEDDVIACLRYLYNERGLKPATRNGPRHWAWFVTVVQDYFSQRERRDESANPTGNAEWEPRNWEREWNEEFRRMTDAIEIDE